MFTKGNRLLHVSALSSWVGVALALAAGFRVASGVTLAWDPSPDESVTGYAIYYSAPLAGQFMGLTIVRQDVGLCTSATITNLTPGTTYHFIATAYTASGLESLPSNEVTYTVPEHMPVGLTNQPPNVTAGADQSVLLSSAAILVGNVSDDGLPTTSGEVTMQWLIVSGPGLVTLESPTTPSTAARFSTVGTYLLRLTATDGELTATDDVQITVFPESSLHPLGLLIEAESGWLSEPMQSLVHFSGEEECIFTSCIATRVAGQGSASFRLEVPESGAYVLWARVLAFGDVTNAFHVSSDGVTAGVLRRDVALVGPDVWQWVCLSSSDGAGEDGSVNSTEAILNPHLLLFEAGTHFIEVAGQATGVLLDKLILTNSRDFIPSDEVMLPIASVATE